MKETTKLAGEFVLIVVGVLVALAVETAFEDRADERLRDEYIARIKLDIESDKRGIGFRVDFFGDVQRFSEEFLLWLDRDDPVDQDILLASFYAAEIWPFVPAVDTYQDLQNTGNIRLLDDIDLRTSLSMYYHKASRSRSGWAPTENFRTYIRSVIPHYVQDLIRTNCPTTDKLDEEPTGFPSCSLPDVDYAALTALYEPLKADVEFRRWLNYRHSEVGVMVYLLSQQSVFADEVLQQIDEQE